jgi:hypothetical protein
MEQGCLSGDASKQVRDVFSLQIVFEMVVSRLHLVVLAGEMNRVCRIGNGNKEKKHRVQHDFENANEVDYICE